MRSSPSLAEMHALLGVMLELSPGEQAAWLERLRRDQPDAATGLETLLAAEWGLDHRRFLEHRPVRSMGETGALAGHSAGPYVLDRPLGEGGMGSVWLAHDSRRDGSEAVAVKLLNLERLTPVGSARFRREERALSRLSHPGISGLVESGVTDAGQPYLVMDFVDGSPVDRYCSSHRLPAVARIRLVLQVVAALGHAHARHVIHRDIKPSNILVKASGAAMLLDFGIAKLLSLDPANPEGTGISKAGGLPFTPEYAAPEQVRGGEISPATDVYALGVLLFQLLGGTHPTAPRARASAEHLRRLLRVPAPRLSTALRHDAGDELATTLDDLRNYVRCGLDDVLMKALQKNPGLRYQSAEAFGSDLERLV